MRKLTFVAVALGAAVFAAGQVGSRAEDRPNPRDHLTEEVARRVEEARLGELQAEYHQTEAELKAHEEEIQRHRALARKKLDELKSEMQRLSAELKQKQAVEAERALEEVSGELARIVRQYPGTPAARRAEEVLKALVSPDGGHGGP
jgi:hypothetical protein